MEQAVNFYILPDSDADNRYFFIFQLVEKAFAKKLPLLIVTDNAEQSAIIDKLLWTAKPERFIPHEIITDKNLSSLPSVVITDRVSQIASSNITPQVVIDVSYDGTPLPFPKIMLIANQHAEILANARMKYQSYVNQGIKPNVHKISEQQLAIV